jgi:hypothetical protein
VKKTILILVLVILLKPLFPVLEYGINYDYISKTLCVNKAKPTLHCNGKCYLMKELAKDSDTKNPISSDKKVSLLVLEILFFQKIVSFCVSSNYFLEKKKANVTYSDLYYYLNGKSFFHPPSILS